MQLGCGCRPGVGNSGRNPSKPVLVNTKTIVKLKSTSLWAGHDVDKRGENW